MFLSSQFHCTVKPVLKGRSDERTPYDQGTHFLRTVFCLPYAGGTPVMKGHFWDLEVSSEDRFHCILLPYPVVFQRSWTAY